MTRNQLALIIAIASLSVNAVLIGYGIYQVVHKPTPEELQKPLLDKLSQMQESAEKKSIQDYNANYTDEIKFLKDNGFGVRYGNDGKYLPVSSMESYCFQKEGHSCVIEQGGTGGATYYINETTGNVYYKIKSLWSNKTITDTLLFNYKMLNVQEQGKNFVDIKYYAKKFRTEPDQWEKQAFEIRDEYASKGYLLIKTTDLGYAEFNPYGYYEQKEFLMQKVNSNLEVVNVD